MYVQTAINYSLWYWRKLKNTMFLKQVLHMRGATFLRISGAMKQKRKHCSVLFNNWRGWRLVLEQNTLRTHQNELLSLKDFWVFLTNVSALTLLSFYLHTARFTWICFLRFYKSLWKSQSSQLICKDSIYTLFWSFNGNLHFKSSLQLLQLFSRTLQHCFVVRLPKFFGLRDFTWLYINMKLRR